LGWEAGLDLEAHSLTKRIRAGEKLSVGDVMGENFVVEHMAVGATFRHLPHFSLIMYACWQKDRHVRPSAALVLQELKLLQDIVQPSADGCCTIC
jgi:hypothetical protein